MPESPAYTQAWLWQGQHNSRFHIYNLCFRKLPPGDYSSTRALAIPVELDAWRTSPSRYLSQKLGSGHRYKLYQLQEGSPMNNKSLPRVCNLLNRRVLHSPQEAASSHEKF